jgi:type IV pilus assembly protein PilV
VKAFFQKNKNLLQTANKPSVTPYGVRSKKSVQSGFSLIEVMIAALILSVGILGLAGLQLISMKGTQESYMKQQAMSVIQSITERMRSNIKGVTDSSYNHVNSATYCASPPATTCNASGSNCNPATIALNDKYNVICNDMKNSLVNGVISIACGLTPPPTVPVIPPPATPPLTGCAVGDVTIQVGWSERAKGQETTSQDRTLLVNTRIFK